MASTFVELGNPTTSIEHYQKILAEHPNYHQSHVGLSQAYWEDGNAEEAIKSAHLATEFQPENVNILAQLGNILASAGDINQANEVNFRALSINPHCVGALVNLAQNLRRDLPVTEVEKMESLLTKSWIKEGQKASLHFGLAHYYYATKQYDEAVNHIIPQ